MAGGSAGNAAIPARPAQVASGPGCRHLPVGRLARRQVGRAAFELHAHPMVRLPPEAAGPRRLFPIDQEVELGRNPDDAFDLQAGTFVRQIPDRAVDDRPSVVEQYLAAPVGAAAMRFPAFFHGLLPTGDRLACIIAAAAGCRSVKATSQFEAIGATVCTARMHGYRGRTFGRRAASVPRTRSSHHNCREFDCELRVQSGTGIIELLVSFDSEVRSRGVADSGELRNRDTSGACVSPVEVLGLLQRSAGRARAGGRKQMSPGEKRCAPRC
jgi:hypothetical protein